jgi:hypothetical protein
MSDFVLDNLPIPTTKSDKTGLPGGQDPNKWWAASDANKLSTYLGSLRDAMVKGRIGATSVFNVRQYGAVGDDVADDLAALQATWSAAITNGGGIVYLPKPLKAYRTTATWVAGTKFVEESDITSVIADYTAAASYNSTNHTAAAALPFVSIIAEPGAIIHGDFSSGPILHYAVAKGSKPNDYAAEIRGLTLLGQPGMTAGVVNTIAGQDAITGTQCGLFSAGSPVKIRDCVAREVYRGFVTSGSYWGAIEHVGTFRTFDAVAAIGANAYSIRNVKAEYAHGTGLVCSGQGISVQRLDTEQCATDIWVVSCDNFSLEKAYLETTDVTHTDYSMRFGVETWKAAATVAAGTYRANDTRKLYLCTTGGITAGSGGPTGTGATITDNTAIWKYVGTVSVNQCVYARVQSVHGSSLYGKHMLLAASQVKVDTSRFYTNSGASLTWVDDVTTSLILDNSTTDIDPACPGTGGVSTWNGLILDALDCLSTKNAGVDTSVGGKASGIQMGSERVWFDPLGLLRWKHGVPSDAHDGNSVAPISTVVNWASFPSLAAGDVTSKDVSFIGNAGDIVSVSPTSLAGSWPDGVTLYGYIRSTGIMRVVCVNSSGSTFNPGSFTFSLAYWAIKY